MTRPSTSYERFMLGGGGELVVTPKTPDARETLNLAYSWRRQSAASARPALLTSTIGLHSLASTSRPTGESVSSVGLPTSPPLRSARTLGRRSPRITSEREAWPLCVIVIWTVRSTVSSS